MSSGQRVLAVNRGEPAPGVFSEAKEAKSARLRSIGKQWPVADQAA
jgi:hypothetical protein